MTDVLIVGAGPAGMAAAFDLQSLGLSVTIVDDQPAPGGRIGAGGAPVPMGRRTVSGADALAQLLAAGATVLSGAEVWQIEPGPRVYLTQHGQARVCTPHFVLLATGALERPMPFPGWQLPGVMTVGAAQRLLTTARQIPAQPVWLAGSGPLLLLYATQLLHAGGAIAGILDTAPRGRVMAAVRHVVPALRSGWRDLARGLAWLARLRHIPRIHDVVALEARGDGRLSTIRYRTRAGVAGDVAAELLCIHDGVVPAVHATMAARCAHRWNPDHACFEPVVDAFGATSTPSVFAAGDGVSIGGVAAAALSGRVAAIGVARAAGVLTEAAARTAVSTLHREREALVPFRRVLHTLFPRHPLMLPDDAMVCRCEEVTAGQVRTALVGQPFLGPNGVKEHTRAGMGPCQGRQCGLTLTRLIAEVHGDAPARIGLLHVRPPLKPLTLAELASLDSTG